MYKCTVHLKIICNHFALKVVAFILLCEIKPYQKKLLSYILNTLLVIGDYKSHI